MTNRGAGCWEIRLSGSKRGWSATLDMDEILWHRRETRRQTENTNIILCRGESPAYSNTLQRINPKGSERQKPTLSRRSQAGSGMSTIDPKRTIIDMFRFGRVDGVYARISKWKRATRIGPI